jgi:hypothetical protein
MAEEVFLVAGPSGNRFTIERALQAGPLTAAELRARLDVSPATLSRLVAAEEGRVWRLGSGRAIRYALPRPIPALPARLPVFRIDEAGRTVAAGELRPLVGGGTWVEREGRGHLHAGLPPVVVDMAPAGYLGRRFAARHPALALPPRLQDWGDDQRLVATARRGEDLPGDLVIGEESMDRHLASTPVAARVEEYPAFADASAEGGAGSSAAGEHPKFAVVRDGRHVLVKFSPGDGSPSDLRWRDLLVCESLALEVLAAHGVASASTRVVDVGARRFLEVERFDRVGLRGRRGVLSLGPIDDDLFGGRDSWTQAAERFAQARLISADDARRMRFLDAFGVLIANGDRHFGNVSFFADGLEERPGLVLAPVYDMLPMSAAPNAGVVPALPTALPAPRAMFVDVWSEALELARRYWARVAADERISAEFRTAAARLAP